MTGLGNAWYGMAMWGTVRRGKTRRGMAGLGMALHGAVWLGEEEQQAKRLATIHLGLLF